MRLAEIWHRARWVRGAAVVIALAPWTATPASAQGLVDFFAGLVGAGKPQQAAPAQVFHPAAPRHLPARAYVSPRALSAPPREDVEPAPRRESGPHYRTVCVRVCDGYYWPMRYAASRRTLHKDADLCRAQCDTEAVMYYMPTLGGEIETARNLQGLPYSSLDTALLYRKKRVPGCACRPMPSSSSELERHRGYAEAEARAAVEKAAAMAAAATDGRPVAGEVPSVTVAAATPDGSASTTAVVVAGDYSRPAFSEPITVATASAAGLPTAADEAIADPLALLRGSSLLTGLPPTAIEPGPSGPVAPASGSPPPAAEAAANTGARGSANPSAPPVAGLDQRSAAPRGRDHRPARRARDPQRRRQAEAQTNGVFGLFGTSSAPAGTGPVWPGDAPRRR